MNSNGRFPSAWRGVGVAARKMGALNEAENALAEANMLNVSSPATWAQLALLCAAPKASAKPRIKLAKSCAAEAFRHGLKDGALLAELGAAFEDLCELPTAERCLRAALAANDADAAIRLRFAAGAFAFALAYSHLRSRSRTRTRLLSRVQLCLFRPSRAVCRGAHPAFPLYQPISRSFSSGARFPRRPLSARSALRAQPPRGGLAALRLPHLLAA